MLNLQDKVSATIKVIALLVLVSFIHVLGEILGGLWIVSDLLLILGAYTTYKLIRDAGVRAELLEGLQGDFDIDGIAGWLINQLAALILAFGFNPSSLVAEEDIVNLDDFLSTEEETE